MRPALLAIALAAATLFPHGLAAKSPGGSILEGLEPIPREPVYGFGVPSSQWGWHGTHFWPYKLAHSGYYKDHLEWSYRWGY